MLKIQYITFEIY